MFLGTSAALPPSIKHDFAACVEELLAVSVHTLQAGKNNVIYETIYQHYLFICIVNTAKKKKKARVYTSDTDLGADLVY